MQTRTAQVLPQTSQWLTYRIVNYDMTRQYKLISQESYCLTVGLYSTDRMSRHNPTNLITYTNTPVPSEISYFQGFFNILQITSSNISQSVS